MTAQDPRATPAPAEGEAGPPRWVLALERAQALAHRAARALEAAPPSRADLRPAAGAVQAALGALFDAIDLRADRLGAIHAAQAELDRAAALVEALPPDAGAAGAAAPLREARAGLEVAEERCARVPAEPAPPPPDLRASRETPALHALRRRSLAPELKLPPPVPAPPEAPPPIPPPRNVEELQAAVAEVRRRSEERRKARQARGEARAAERAARAKAAEAAPVAGFAKGRHAALSAADFVTARARECFEEVALAGSQRAPLPGDPWQSAQVLERRMLTAVDAVAGLGPHAVGRIEPLALDAPARDPARAFAAAMILGCVEGRDAIAAAERVLRAYGAADPEIAAAWAGALKLAPHPALPLALRTLLADPDPACRAIAVEVLAYRGWATPAELASAAADADVRVVAAALPGLGLARAPELGEVARPALAAAEPAVREAAWTALALAGHPHAIGALQAELRGPLAPAAAQVLALAGDDRDAAAILERLRAAPAPGLAAAAGWAGAPDAVPALIDLLEHLDPAVQLAAAEALERITGAGLVEEVEVAAEEIAVPEVQEPDVGEPGPPPLARLVSDPRDLPSEGANETITRPTLRPERWRAFWAERLPDIRPGARYRRGRPYTPAVSLWELTALPLSMSERRALLRELVIRTGQLVRCDPHDLVAVQEEALRQWAPLADRASATPGGWGRPARR